MTSTRAWLPFEVDKSQRATNGRGNVFSDGRYHLEDKTSDEMVRSAAINQFDELESDLDSISKAGGRRKNIHPNVGALRMKLGFAVWDTPSFESVAIQPSLDFEGRATMNRKRKEPGSIDLKSTFWKPSDPGTPRNIKRKDDPGSINLKSRYRKPHDLETHQEDPEMEAIRKGEAYWDYSKFQMSAQKQRKQEQSKTNRLLEKKVVKELTPKQVKERIRQQTKKTNPPVSERIQKLSTPLAKTESPQTRLIVVGAAKSALTYTASPRIEALARPKAKGGFSPPPESQNEKTDHEPSTSTPRRPAIKQRRSKSKNTKQINTPVNEIKLMNDKSCQTLDVVGKYETQLSPGPKKSTVNLETKVERVQDALYEAVSNRSFPNLAPSMHSQRHMKAFQALSAKKSINDVRTESMTSQSALNEAQSMDSQKYSVKNLHSIMKYSSQSQSSLHPTKTTYCAKTESEQLENALSQIATNERNTLKAAPSMHSRRNSVKTSQSVTQISDSSPNHEKSTNYVTTEFEQVENAINQLVASRYALNEVQSMHSERYSVKTLQSITRSSSQSYFSLHSNQTRNDVETAPINVETASEKVKAAPEKAEIASTQASQSIHSQSMHSQRRSAENVQTVLTTILSAQWMRHNKTAIGNYKARREQIRLEQNHGRSWDLASKVPDYYPSYNSTYLEPNLDPEYPPRTMYNSAHRSNINSRQDRYLAWMERVLRLNEEPDAKKIKDLTTTPSQFILAKQNALAETAIQSQPKTFDHSLSTKSYGRSEVKAPECSNCHQRASSLKFNRKPFCIKCFINNAVLKRKSA